VTLRAFVKKHPQLVPIAKWAFVKYKCVTEFIVYHLVYITSIGVRPKRYPWAVMKGPRNLAEKWDMLGESEVIDFITHLAPKGVCIDAGAWVGKYSLLMSKTARRVIALEPDRLNFRFLVENIHINNAKHVHPLQMALDSQDGEALLSVSHATAGHSIEGAQAHYNYNVRTITLRSLIDEYMGEDNEIDLIKMDIERTELLILPSLDDQIFQLVKQWLIEVHSKNQSEEQMVIECFKKHGYHKLTWLEPSTWTKPRHLYARN
jgi:FkbM family methyltransferase